VTILQPGEFRVRDYSTTRGSDMGERSRVRDIKRTVAAHQARMAAKLTGEEVPEPRRKSRKITSRPFLKGYRPFRTSQ
jgi:hypothetical protein